MAVTKEQILSAADELAAAGQKPTLEAIRQITGGSYTTISPALNEWKARQATAAQPLREPAPQAVADRLAEVGAEVWGIALELANARLASEREALEKARTDLEADRAEATELADRLAAQVEELQSRLAWSRSAWVAASCSAWRWASAATCWRCSWCAWSAASALPCTFANSPRTWSSWAAVAWLAFCCSASA